jgi:hypothetical protein
MSRFVVLALAAMVLALPANAADHKFDAEACAKAVAPYLDDQTVAVLHVDLSLFDADALVTKAAALGKLDAEDLSPIRNGLKIMLKALTDSGARDLFLVVSLADVPERSAFLVVPLPPGKAAENGDGIKGLREKVEGASFLGSLHLEPVGDALIAADESTLKRLRSLKPADRPQFAKAIAAADGDLAHLVVVPPKDAAKILDSVMPTLPAEVGGGSSKVVTQGFRWAAAGLTPNLKLNLTVQATDADSAKALFDLLKKTYAVVIKNVGPEYVPDFEKATKLLTPVVTADRLTLNLNAQTLAAALHADKAVDALARASSAHSLKQLLIAAHNYDSSYSTFPPAYSTDKNGKPLLSWRVYLLPFLEEDKLYKEFHLDEPWDSDHNKKLIARMPAVFRSSTNPKLAADFKTTYLAPVGEATMWPGAKGVRITDVPDGTSNTIFLVDADDDHAVVWTKPEDLDYDAKTPMKGLGGRYHNVFLAAMADGSVRTIYTSISKTTLQAAFTRNGGEVLGPDW